MKPEPGIIRDGRNGIWITLTYGDIVVKERIPLYVTKMDIEEQAGYYRGVSLRLERKIRQMTVPVAVRPNRHQRRAKAVG